MPKPSGGWRSTRTPRRSPGPTASSVIWTRSTTRSRSASPTSCIWTRSGASGSGVSAPRPSEHLPVRRAVGLVVGACGVLDHDGVAASAVVDPDRKLNMDLVAHGLVNRHAVRRRVHDDVGELLQHVVGAVLGLVLA